jgi:chaperonin cofactor prefoldin
MVTIFEEDVTKVLLKFLDRKAKEAEDEIMSTGVLSEEKAIPLILKVQFNHIAHLDFEITELRKLMDERFERMEKRFEKIDERFERIDERFEKIDERFRKIDERFEKIDERFERIDERFRRIDERFEKIEKRIVTWLGVGFSVLAALITIFAFVK